MCRRHNPSDVNSPGPPLADRAHGARFHGDDDGPRHECREPGQPPTTACDALATTSARLADHPALRSAGGRIDWSWGEYWRRARAAPPSPVLGSTTPTRSRSGSPIARSSTSPTAARCCSAQRRSRSANAHGRAGRARHRRRRRSRAHHRAGVPRQRPRRPRERPHRGRDGRARGRRVPGWSAGRSWTAPRRFDVDEAIAGVTPDDLVTLIYTSGPPVAEGLMTHRNVTSLAALLRSRRPSRGSAGDLPAGGAHRREDLHPEPMLLGWR